MCSSDLTLYLWRSSEEKVAVDLHLVVLADEDGAYIILGVAPRRRLQSTCTSSSLRIGMCFELKRVLDCS